MCFPGSWRQRTLPLRKGSETYVYKMGISMGMYSYSTAISLLQTVIGFILVWLTNKLSQKTTDYSLW